MMQSDTMMHSHGHTTAHGGEAASLGARPSDEQLIQRIACRDEDAFTLFFRRWAPRLGSFILRSTGCPEAADDLVQEAFIRIYRAAGRYEARGHVSAWVLRIAANLTYSHWRTRNRSRVDSVDLQLLTQRTPAAAHYSPQQRRERAQFRSDLDAAIGALPPNQRMAFLLKIEQGLTYAQIGEVLRCPEGTVKSRFHHAMLKLRTSLREWSPQTEGPHGEGAPVGGPHGEGTPAEGPHGEGTPAEGPHAEGPHAEGPHAEGPHAEGPRADGPRDAPERHEENQQRDS
jgi:RNA polymerase sigma-70 factor, ECF subfamily